MPRSFHAHHFNLHGLKLIMVKNDQPVCVGLLNKNPMFPLFEKMTHRLPLVSLGNNSFPQLHVLTVVLAFGFTKVWMHGIWLQ